ncbi:MAG: type 1 glutamine amidotransferase, partial [Nitrospirae bacterium]|nr:type 1 glutamine amidotransferase [Nitrospirota bacterium]
ENRIPYRVAEYSKGDRPATVDDYTHLVIMGGPMAVYEMDRYPYLKDEAKLIEDFVKKGRAVLGVCLGAQMLAHVLGARVYPGEVKEIGWFKVELTEEGLNDPAIKELEIDGSGRAEVFQWHGDTFDLPEGAKRIASSEAYPNQAFVYNNNVYALQFHIEVTPEIIRQWFEHDEDTDRALEMVRHAEEIFKDYLQRAMGFYRNFFQSSLSNIK